MFLCSRPGTSMRSFQVISALSSSCHGNVFHLSIRLGGRHAGATKLDVKCRLLSGGKGMMTGNRRAMSMLTNGRNAMSFDGRLPRMGA